MTSTSTDSRLRSSCVAKERALTATQSRSKGTSSAYPELEADVVRLEAALAGARAEARQKDVIMFALEARLANVDLSSAITTTSYVAFLV
jgi:hypothetical protein